MSAFLLFIFFLLVFIRGLPAQDYRFTRQDGVYRLVEPRETVVLAPPVDMRPLWLRALRSLRHWVKSSPGTRLDYDEDLDLYRLDGAIGVGLRGKVEF